jgi:4-amino-4-deoxy-L-arabinose transferase-like glycosyltransferase
MAFLGSLGSVDLWGKREQRAAAEAIDTIDHGHWLVAEIQGHPRLEKPPLPRWMIAALCAVTGSRSQWTLRLPGAICALATVSLVYFLGRRMAGRQVALASALALCSLGFFVKEMRQAGNDGPLAFFTTLALFAAWRRIHADPSANGGTVADGLWSKVGCAAMGLGFLTKGPIILMFVAVTVLPYLAFSGSLARGVRRLADGWALSLLVVLAASWPITVWWSDPNALGVWLLEISEKTGVWQTLPHRDHAVLVTQWVGMALPWSIIALVAVVLPFFPKRPAGFRERQSAQNGLTRDRSPLWFAWWWAVGNLGVLSFWAVAKPNYYVPCMPGVALLIGAAWVRLAEGARGRGSMATVSRAILQANWVLLFVSAAMAPIAARTWLPADAWPWSVAIGVVLGGAVVLSASTWRRRADAMALAPITAGCVLVAVIGYGVLAPIENARRSHRALAGTLRDVIPHDVRSLYFFNEIDEGLAFYLSGLELVPVPGSQPRYNSAFDLVDAYRTRRIASETIEELDVRRHVYERRALREWLARHALGDCYLLIRASLYDRMAPELIGAVTPLFRESELKRNELVLLRVEDPRRLAAARVARARS